MSRPGPTPKPNSRRAAPHADRRNAEVTGGAGHYDPGLAAHVLRQTDRHQAVVKRWARSVLSSPQAEVFTNAEVSMVEVGAHALNRWIANPRARTADLAEWLRINDRLLSDHASRLRARVEIAPRAAEARDELAEARAVRARLR